MSKAINKLLDTVKPEWLTSILEQQGALSDGNVSSIEQSPSEFYGETSTFLSLKVDYSPKSIGSRPSRLLIKITKPEYYELGQKEVYFYDTVATSGAVLPLTTCYKTGILPESKQCYLLFEDLSLTHQSLEQVPPTEGHYQEAIRILAKIHAYWWNHSKIGTPFFDSPSDVGVCQSIQQIEKYFPKFVDALGDRLSKKRKETYSLVFEKLPKLFWSRLSDSQRLTLVHGDTHLRNFLFPHNPKQHSCVLADWQFWHIGISAGDLSFMIALHCPLEWRQKWEKPLLQLYLEALKQESIDCVWTDIWTDYRVATISNLFLPIMWYSRNPHPPFWWWPHLERTFIALEDLNCLEFL